MDFLWRLNWEPGWAHHHQSQMETKPAWCYGKTWHRRSIRSPPGCGSTQNQFEGLQRPGRDEGYRNDVSRAEEDQPRPSTLEKCCCSSMLSRMKEENLTSKKNIFECLELICGRHCRPPRVRFIEQKWFRIGIEHLLMVLTEKSLDAHTFLNCRKTALVFPSLIFPSASVPRCLLRGTAKISETFHF